MNYIFKGNSYSSIFLTNKVSIKKLLIVTLTIPSRGFIFTCLHKLRACDCAIPSTAVETKNHRHPSKKQQNICSRQGLQIVLVQSSLIFHIYKHNMSFFQCYSSKLNDKCDIERRSWKLHRQKERAQVSRKKKAVLQRISSLKLNSQDVLEEEAKKGS